MILTEEQAHVMRSRHFVQGNSARLHDLSISTRLEAVRLRRVMDSLISMGCLQDMGDGHYRSLCRARDIAFGKWPNQGGSWR